MGRAHEDVEAAEEVLLTTHPDRAAGDAYYAMFHAAEALLLSLGMEFSKHSATHAAFGKYFSKPGRVPQQLHRYMLDAFDARLTTEYDVTVKLRVEKSARSWAKRRSSSLQPSNTLMH